MASRVKVDFGFGKEKKPQIRMESQGKFVDIDGKRYYPDKAVWSNKVKGHYITFKEVSEEERIKIMGHIIHKIAPKLSVEEILEEILSKVEFKQLREIDQDLKKKVKPKKVGGCLGIRIGKNEISIA